jgi:hypothetical protein
MGRPESGFWNSTVKPNAPGFWQRIESPTTDGIPDCCAILDGRVHWVELKALKAFESGLGTAPIQRYWMGRWREHGGSAWVLARVGKRVLFLDAAFLPWKLDPLDDTLSFYLEHAAVEGTTRSFDWGAVQRVMSR